MENINSPSEANTLTDVPKETLIKVLKLITKDLFPDYQNIVKMSDMMCSESMSYSVKRMYLIDKNEFWKKDLKEISDRVFAKYGVEEKDVKFACENTYRDDPMITGLLAERENILEKAVNGVEPPDMEIEIPAFLTSEKILELEATVMKKSCLKVQQYITEKKAQGEQISFENPIGEVVDSLIDLKRDILNEALGKFEDSANSIFQYASRKYSTADGFAERLKQLEKQNEKVMQALMTGSEADALINAIGGVFVEEKEEKEEKKEDTIGSEVLITADPLLESQAEKVLP
jgi:hypothetical protein